MLTGGQKFRSDTHMTSTLRGGGGGGGVGTLKMGFC